nr:hypothetical protein [Rhizobium anhuiense]
MGTAPTVSDIVLKFIRDFIMDGTLDEGEPIRQDDVARMFNRTSANSRFVPEARRGTRGQAR